MLWGTCTASEHSQDVLGDSARRRRKLGDHARGQAVGLPKQAEEDVLGTDPVVAEDLGLSERVLEHPFCTRSEGNLAGGDLLTRRENLAKAAADRFEIDLPLLQDPSRDAFLLAEKPEQEVLRADPVVSETPRLVLREDDDLTSPPRESLEHSPADASGWAAYAGGNRAESADAAAQVSSPPGSSERRRIQRTQPRFFVSATVTVSPCSSPA
jgi:hypothetical protein